MHKNESSRRHFIRISSAALGTLTLSPLAGAASGRVLANNLTRPEGGKLNIICVGAHPGDPEFGCGGTMAKYSDAGHSVTFLYLTRGEAWAGDPSLSHVQAAALRTLEAENSCKILNAKPLFAGQVDGDTELNSQRAEEFKNLLLSVNPDIVFSHWPIDSHRDHQVAGCLTLNAWLKTDRQFVLYFYEVDTGSETMGFTPTDYVDITDVSDRKKQAMFAHKSQGPEAIYEKDFRAMEDFRGLEAGVMAAEAFIQFKTKAARSGIIGLF